jgi:ribosome biogenesis protein NSA2
VGANSKTYDHSLTLRLAELKATFQLHILGVKKNPQSPMYTQLGVMTKGTVIEVNVSELGMVTAGGKVSSA